MLSYIPGFIKNISVGRFILALALAVIVWGYVMTTQYPEKTTTYVIDLVEQVPPPPELMQVNNSTQSNTVRVTLSGPAELVSAIVPTQIRPYLDLSEIRQPGNPDVPVKLKPQLLPPDVDVKIDPKSIPVSLETVTTKMVKVSVVSEGVVNPDYYLNVPPEISPVEVMVKGRQSLVDRVTKAQVTVNLSGRVGPLQAISLVQLQDSKGQPITDSGLLISPSQVSVSANIDYKFLTRTVPVRVVTEGDPAVGYIAGSARANPTVVTLSSGNGDLLNKINFVETEPLNIKDATSEISGTVRLKVPVDTTVIQNNELIQVRIGIVPFQTSNRLAVPVQFLNQANNYRYSYSASTVDLVISGPYQAVKDLGLEKIKATIDLGDRGPGVYQLPVLVELSSNELVLTNIPSVTVTIIRAPVPTAAPVPPTAPPTTATPTAATTATPPALTLTPGPAVSPSGPTPSRPPATVTRTNSPVVTPGAVAPPGLAPTPFPTTPLAEVPPEKVSPVSTPGGPGGTEPDPTPRRSIGPPITASSQQVRFPVPYRRTNLD